MIQHWQISPKKTAINPRFPGFRVRCLPDVKSVGFTNLNDAIDAPPVPLPRLNQEKLVTLVRHGQSTWNARSIIQGSSDISVLTEKGVAQANETYLALKDEHFDELFYSPLQRATQTADIVWGSRSGPTTCLPSLREIDLYSLEGCSKSEAKTYTDWKENPAKFELDGHAPVRELWYRASLAWHALLSTQKSSVEGESRDILVVAHNAVNQALVCTALGLPPTYFRRITQSNGAYTQLRFSVGGGRVTAERINQGVLSGPYYLEKGAMMMICGSKTESNSPASCQNVVAAKLGLQEAGVLKMEHGGISITEDGGILLCSNNFTR